VIYTPDMAARVQAGGASAANITLQSASFQQDPSTQGGDPSTTGGKRRGGRRNGGNFTGDMSSIPMNPGAASKPPVTGSVVVPSVPAASKPPVSTPAITAKPVTKPVVKPAPPVKAPKPILTSFVITCRVNMHKQVLIAAPAAGGKTAARDTAQKTTGKSKNAASDDVPDDNGDDNADPQ